MVNLLLNRFFIITFGLVFTHFNLYSQQNKRNNMWTLGYDPVITFNFNSGVLQPVPLQQLTSCREASCISDTNGNLLFYCVGFAIGDKNGNLLDNGKNINCPYGNQLNIFYGEGARSTQMTIIIPKKNNQYYVFGTGMSDSVAQILMDSVIYLGYDVLNYSVVDMDGNAGLGSVITKNKVILNNQRYANCAMTAVKHGNGYDWWLVKEDIWKHQLQTFLVKEDTIEGPFYYTIADTTNSSKYYSEIYFSDDGTKMASNSQWQLSIPGTQSLGLYNRVDLFDFDRCSGQFSYRNYYSVPNDTLSYPYENANVGMSFSPNGKLIYLINWYNIYQIDVEDTNIYNGVLIHGPDDSLSVFPSYHIGKCAPDGKLYIGNFDGIRNSMSYIDSPNVRGQGCHFIPKGLVQNFNTNLKGPPNMPNYGLGGNGLCIPASTFDTPKTERNFDIYPNPASTEFSIEYELKRKEEAILYLYDLSGKIVRSKKLDASKSKEKIDVSNLSIGLYTYKISVNAGENYNGKIIVD